MKKTFFLLFFFLCSTFSFSQVYKYRAQFMTHCVRNGSGGWTNWENWTPAEAIFTVDLQSKRITEFTSAQTYNDDFFDFHTGIQDENGNTGVEFKCVDGAANLIKYKILSIKSEYGKVLIRQEYDFMIVCFKADVL